MPGFQNPAYTPKNIVDVLLLKKPENTKLQDPRRGSIERVNDIGLSYKSSTRIWISLMISAVTII